MKALIRATLWTGIATLCRAISLFAIAKIIALEIGPQGLGQVGQFLSLMTLLGVLAGGGVVYGLVRYIAEADQDRSQRATYIATGLRISVFSSISVAVIGAIGSYPLASAILGSTNFVSLIWILCGVQFCVAGNNLLLGILNGHKDAKSVALASIGGLVSGLLSTAILTYHFKLYGALLGLMILQASPFFFSYLFLRRATWYSAELFSGQFSSVAAKNLMSYSLMAIFTALLTPAAQIYVRSLIESRSSWAAVGIWQATTRFSDVIALFATTTLTVYYLPKLAQAKNDQDIRLDVATTASLMLPLVFVGAITLYIFRIFFIRLLFSSEFLEVSNYLGPQLIGDLLRVCSWLLAYIMLAKSYTRLFMLTELVATCIYCALAFALTKDHGTVGAVWASTITAGVYAMTMAVVFRRYLPRPQTFFGAGTA